MVLPRRALKSWSKPLFSKARLQLHIANEVILRLDIAQEDRQLSDAEQTLRKDLKLRALGLAAVERVGGSRPPELTGSKQAMPVPDSST